MEITYKQNKEKLTVFLSGNYVDYDNEEEKSILYEKSQSRTIKEIVVEAEK